MSRPEFHLQPRVYYIEGGDDVRSFQRDAFVDIGLNVGLIAMSLAQVAQQIESGWVKDFDPHVAVVSEALVDGLGSQVQPLFHRSRLEIPTIAYTSRPVFWRDTFGFCLAPNVGLLKRKIDEVVGAHRPSTFSPRVAK